MIIIIRIISIIILIIIIMIMIIIPIILVIIITPILIIVIIIITLIIIILIIPITVRFSPCAKHSIGNMDKHLLYGMGSNNNHWHVTNSLHFLLQTKYFYFVSKLAWLDILCSYFNCVWKSLWVIYWVHTRSITTFVIANKKKKVLALKDF